MNAQQRKCILNTRVLIVAADIKRNEIHPSSTVLHDRDATVDVLLFPYSVLNTNVWVTSNLSDLEIYHLNSYNMASFWVKKVLCFLVIIETSLTVVTADYLGCMQVPYEPVCGSNNRTYPNECFLRVYNQYSDGTSKHAVSQ